MWLPLLLVACSPGRADVAPGSVPLTEPWSTWDLPLYGAEVSRSDPLDLDVRYRNDQDTDRCGTWTAGLESKLGPPRSHEAPPGGGALVLWKDPSDTLTSMHCGASGPDIVVSIDVIAAEATP